MNAQMNARWNRRFSVGAPCFSRGTWTSVQRKKRHNKTGFSPGNQSERTGRISEPNEHTE